MTVTVADIEEALAESEERLTPPLRPLANRAAIARAARERDRERERRDRLTAELAEIGG